MGTAGGRYFFSLSIPSFINAFQIFVWMYSCMHVSDELQTFDINPCYHFNGIDVEFCNSNFYISYHHSQNVLKKITKKKLSYVRIQSMHRPYLKMYSIHLVLSIWQKYHPSSILLLNIRKRLWPSTLGLVYLLCDAKEEKTTKYRF